MYDGRVFFSSGAANECVADIPGVTVRPDRCTRPCTADAECCRPAMPGIPAECADEDWSCGVTRGQCDWFRGEWTAQIFNPALTYAAGWLNQLLDTRGGINRWYNTVTVLPNRDILITGGYDEGYKALARVDAAPDSETRRSYWQSAEVFSPLTNAFAWVGPAADGRPPERRVREAMYAENYPHVFVLPRTISKGGGERDVLIFGDAGAPVYLSLPGGSYANATWYRDTQERPGGGGMAGSSSALLPLAVNSNGVLLQPSPFHYSYGSVFVANGSNDAGALSRFDVYDPDTNWSMIGDATHPVAIERHHPNAVLLPDETILVLGGHRQRDVPPGVAYTSDQRTAQRFNPADGTFENGQSYNTAVAPTDGRGYHTTAILLPDARVLIAGGRNYSMSLPWQDYRPDERADFQIYTPSYLVGASRPSFADASIPEWHYDGAPLTLGCSSNTAVQKVVMMALGSDTHAFDMGQRSIRLSMTRPGSTNPLGNCTSDVGIPMPNTIDLELPTDQRIAPPGYYMIFLLTQRTTSCFSDRWIPSEAKFVHLN